MATTQETRLTPQETAERLDHFIAQHPRLFILTGAGISTDSGIPDYRDKHSQWKRQPPVQHHDFINKIYTRQRFWARSLIGWPIMRDAIANTAHHWLVSLESAGHVQSLVTQNVDGLHQQAGLKNVIDLHGRSDRVICMQCQKTLSRDKAHLWMAELNPSFAALTATAAPDGDADLEDVPFEDFVIPDCPSCGGLLKPDVVFYGDNVPKERVETALNHLAQSDALLVIGSSLMVYSGFRFCKRAHKAKKPIALLNQGITRADSIATLKLDSVISPVLEACRAF
ncbi:NAD-dependent protein deacetylase [Neptunomonas phycophila]|uniref:NAD-dependent protein deacetylase n=1 Tax=Neptunomonas phycophila TaxID=1572645 RepID=UPI0026E3D7E4|nr:NAD-dependent protein deacetylase [Neptunomonas phycophila]MDO6784041.1 NAD-dependent protein deacetylase [Neptunomonas phycophila]